MPRKKTIVLVNKKLAGAESVASQPKSILSVEMQEEREERKSGNVQQAVEVKNSSNSSSKYPYVPVAFLMVATSGQE